jgi:murein DD-endopeptidase MepM/ murein hydrolase activator NlpD
MKTPAHIRPWIAAVLAMVFTVCSCGYYHTVKSGETLSSIAKKYNLNVNDIVGANKNITDKDKIKVDQKLRIPREKSPTYQKLQEQKKNDRFYKSRRIDKPAKKNDAKQPEQRQEPQPVKAAPIEGKPQFIWPVRGPILAKFGPQADGRTNDGIDIGAPEGTDVVAAADGEVIAITDKYAAYGNLILVRHDVNYITVYAHNQVNLVKKGDKVHKGQVIAKVGQTGRVASPRLHFEIRVGVNPTDPLQHLPADQ